MMNDSLHPSDEDLVRAADGELDKSEKASIAAHLERCWTCRERLDSLERTIHQFVRAYHVASEGKILPIAGPRALLKARLAEARHTAAPRLLWRGVLAMGTAVPLVIVLALTLKTAANAGGERPKPGITVGEVRPITMQEVCSKPNAEVIRTDIPEDLQRKVFSAYGVKMPKAGEYEVDYLITPDLGGTGTIRNLWPQRYSPHWNASRKDELEQRLHQLVCAGQLDLAGAQRAISSDWVAAYKKYVTGENR